ncbi:MAG: ATP-binding cassette domain-containing protein, partial [Anaerovoracaceae bacterium]
GAGKSTLLNLIAGLDQPTGGTIEYDGRPLLPAEEVTLVFQKPYLLTTDVRRNIAYPMKLRGSASTEINTRVNALMEELGLSALADQKAWKLSGGEAQKVALARALSFHPKLLLLDEPTANVDPATTGEIEKMLLKVNQQEETTIVLITHNLAQAKRLCQNVLFLHQGACIESGPADLLLSRPSNALTADFIAGELLL